MTGMIGVGVTFIHVFKLRVRKKIINRDLGYKGIVQIYVNI